MLPQYTRLLIAIVGGQPGHLALVKRLLDKGVHPDGPRPAEPCRQGLIPALHRACFDANLEVVEMLLAAGADINRPDASSRTALHAWFLGVDSWLSQWWPGQPHKTPARTLDLGALLVRHGARMDMAAENDVAISANLRTIAESILAPSRALYQRDELREKTPVGSELTASARRL